MKRTAKTSLARSHSASSNFLLTLICLLAALAFAGLFLTLGFYSSFAAPLFWVLLLGSGGLLVLSLFLLFAFKR